MGNAVFEASDTAGVWIGQKNSEGPTVAILGGVHGDEPTGIEVVQQSLDNLNFEAGTVILILGNLAAQGNCRFQDVNLNRNFRELTPEEAEQEPEQRPYEVNRAQELLPYLKTADAALDLHDFTNPCDPFIICERNALVTARTIGAPIISFGWSQTEPGGSDGFMFEQGKEGLCYELGQKAYPKANLERGHGAVSRFLIAHDMIDITLPPLYDNPELVQTSVAFIRTTGRFWLAREFTNFEKLQPGELIATADNHEIVAEEGQVIIFPMPDAKVGEEAFTLGKRVTA